MSGYTAMLWLYHFDLRVAVEGDGLSIVGEHLVVGLVVNALFYGLNAVFGTTDTDYQWVFWGDWTLW